MLPFVLLVEATDYATQAQRKLRHSVANMGLPLRVCAGPETALTELEHQESRGAQATLILLGSHLESPLAVARRLHQRVPQAHLFFLVKDQDEALRAQLQSPLARIGRYWSILELGDEGSAILLEQASRSARQRLQLRTTLNQINTELTLSRHDWTKQYLRVSDRFFANILEHSHDAIIATNNEGVVITWNSAARVLFGLSPDEAVGKLVGEVAGGDWPEQLPRLIARLRAADSVPIKRELVCRRNDGRRLDIELALSIVREESDQPIGFSAIVRNITERKQAERALRESEKRLYAILDSSPPIICMLDTDSRYLFVNRQWERVVGITRDKALGKSPYECWPRDTAKTLMRSHQALLEGGQPVEQEDTLFLEGETHTYYSYRFPLFDGEGTIYAVCVISSDITERKRAEEQFRLAVEAASSAMVMINDKGRITLVNRQTEVLFGYDRRELMGKAVEMLIPARFRKGHPGLRKQYFASPEARPMGAGRDLFGLRKDGSEFPVEIGLNPIQTEEGRFFLSSIVDITLRKQLEEVQHKANQDLERQVEQRTQELKEINEKLEQSNIELTRFAYIASHDLQTPLRSISGFLQLLQAEYRGRLDEQADHWIDRVVENTHRMKTLINDLLFYTRIESQARPFTPLRCRDLFNDAVEGLAASIQEAVAEVRCDDLPTINGDRSQLVQLLQNLIGNGIKYNESIPPRVRVTARKNGNAWIFSVSDNGIGIAAKHHEKIFEAFQRLHTQHRWPGTGIGLAVCRRIVHHHGGRIWVDSEPGKGSVFYFSIPDRGVPHE